jgi:hypothetical protein
MQPITVTLNSSGSSPWKLTNWHVTAPMNIGFSAVTAGASLTTFQIDYTVEDPTFTFLNSTGIYPNSSGVTIFSTYPATSSGYTNFYTSITTPIAAWRLTVTASSGAVVSLTALQVGIG